MKQCKSCAPSGTCRELQTGLGEECGVFGAYDLSGKDVAHSVYYGLFALQHRGQESCGIAVTSTVGHRKFLSHKGLGLVNEVFDAETLKRLPGSLGIGHVRYSTAGATRLENAMPLVINYIKGALAIAHNGTAGGTGAERGYFSDHHRFGSPRLSHRTGAAQ